MNVDFYQGIHDAQIKRNEHFTNELRLTVSVLVILGGAFGFIRPNISLNFPPNDLISFVSVLYWLAGFAYLFALIYLVKAYLVPTLKDLNTAQSWLEHYKELQVKYGCDKKGLAKEFNLDLAHQLAEAASVNQNVNDRIGNAVNSSNKYLLFALLLILPSLLFSQTISSVEQQPNIKKECIS